ncbi:MAG: type 1 glutamine amidotransferase [Candidatus Altiarchaeota archaeon]
MNVHLLQHVPNEGPANIAAWARERGHKTACTRLYLGESLPLVGDFDLIAVLGGPMNAYADEKHAWLAREKTFLAEAVDAKKCVLGVCLGAQLLSIILGGKVTRNNEREIGWHETSITDEGRRSRAFAGFPEKFRPMHWHADTFTIPEGCTRTAASKACANQAFEGLDGKVVGLQFHLEYSMQDVRTMATESADDLVPGRYVGTPYGILTNAWRTSETKRLIFLLLDSMAEGL